MDEDEEFRKIKFFLIAMLVFVISAFFSWQEFRFLVWGKTAQANITRTFDTRSGGRRSSPLKAVEYTFTDAATGPRNERDDVAIDFPLSRTTVTVQYLPGVADSSRLLGNSRTFLVWIFFGCLAWLGYSGFKIYREASEPDYGRKRRRKAAKDAGRVKR